MDIEHAKRIIAACLANAHDLIRVAKRALDDERLPNVAYHLSVLALEEIGKSCLVGMRPFATMRKEDTTFIDSRLDDHVFKLFWALWTPSFRRGHVSKDEWDSVHGMASVIHENRLTSMYVDFPLDGSEPTAAKIDEEQARTILGLAEARLGMEGMADWDRLDLSPGSDLHWFIQASDEPEKRKLILGQKSFEKLGELRSTVDWVSWLRAQSEQADAEAAAYLKQELERSGHDADDLGEDKWRLRFRLHSPTQSVRNSAIKEWNSWSNFIALATIQNNPHALDIQLTFREGMPFQALGNTAYRVARTFLAALNIGSVGFWWWQPLRQLDHFHETITDLKAPAGMMSDFRIHSWPKFEWKREALKVPELNRVGLCFGMAMQLPEDIYAKVIETYLTGIALIGKSDLHLNFVIQAAERFVACLMEAMRHFGNWDGDEVTIEPAIRSFLSRIDGEANNLDELIAITRTLRTGKADPAVVTMERAAMFKVLCDAYLINHFQGEAQRRTVITDGAAVAH